MRGEESLSRRRLWRRLSLAPIPLLVVIHALWRDVLSLNATGVRLRWEAGAVGEWLAMALGTLLVASAFWAPQRPVRVLGYTFYSLVLAFGFGAAGVIAVVHAFGGPRGDLHAPAWALAGLAATCVLCFASLLAHAALLVEDVRAGEREED